MTFFNSIPVLTVILTLVNNAGFSQDTTTEFKATAIEPYHLLITFNKTTNLIFPYSIKSVDRGSRYVLAQKAVGIENVLQIKAGRENFTQSNLSVITADGKFYSFTVDYSPEPPVLTLSFARDVGHTQTPKIIHNTYNEAVLILLTEKIAKNNERMFRIMDRRFKVGLRLNGFYTRSGVIFCKLEISNWSNIPFNMDMLLFSLRDTDIAKRTAMQEIQIKPLYVYGNPIVVSTKLRRTVVAALPMFTIPDNKHLAIQIMEKDAGRQLSLRVRTRAILKAKPL